VILSIWFHNREEAKNQKQKKKTFAGNFIRYLLLIMIATI
jgi:hypothetical protein